MTALARSFLVKYWGAATLTLLLAIFVGWLSFYRLQSLSPNLNSNEIATISQSQHLKQILNNPVNAPYKLLQFVIQHYTNHTIFLERLVSVVVGLLILGTFYLVLRMRYRYYVAVFGCALLGSSTWFLYTARLATADITLMGIIILIWVGQLLNQAKHEMLVTFFAVLICGSLLYVPGMFWFLLFGFLWQQSFLTRLLDSLAAWFRVLVVFLGVGLVTPLCYAAVHKPMLLESIAGLPSHFLSPFSYARNLLEVPTNLFLRGPGNPSQWLGRLPVLDVFITVMFALGLYCYWVQRRLDFPKLVVGALIVGTILISSGGPLMITVLLPLVYLVAAGGIAELLQEWFGVFPRNPLARAVGVGLLTIAVIAAGYYQSFRYFVAWPDSTKILSITQNKIEQSSET